MFYINNIEYSNLLIFSILINATIYVFLCTQKARQSHSTKLFRWFILSTILVAVFEALGWIIAVPGNESLIPFNYLSNVLFFSFNILPAACGLRYLDYIIYFSKEKNRKKFFLYLTPVYLNIVFVICNIFFDGFLFSIDSANVYHRGIATYIGNGFTFLFAAIIVIGFFRNKQMITGRITQVILTLTLLPVAGVVLQMLFYGLSLSIPAYTLAIFISFLLMERNELLKDPLTLLNSRAQMESRLQYKLKAREPFTAVMIDVNDFKKINDIYGHTVGDKVLKDVSRILLSSANFEDFVCRFGGDEFFVILESADDIGYSYTKRVDQALLEYCSNKSYSISLSYGHLYVDHSVEYEVEELVRTTDQLMYKDKITGRH
ncbi:MAG: GGDEF domain-containing protein [Oscillospiraceae bacterium]|nr:GGDEF domain-containing protein [Oscillospiraceae bacterium]